MRKENQYDIIINKTMKVIGYFSFTNLNETTLLCFASRWYNKWMVVREVY